MRGMLSEHVAVSPRRWMYLPISVNVRELDGNALLAFEAAERGWGVILCRKVPRDEPGWPCGVHFKKNIAPGPNREPLLAWKAKGGKIDAWCEEGLVYPSAEEYGQRKLDPKMFGMLDRYYCWGQNQADDMIGKLGCDADKISVTGNPRFDLHRSDLRTLFDDRVQRIRRKYAPLILINTKFSRYNNDVGTEAKLAKMRGLGRVQTEEQEDYQRGVANFQAVGFEKFMELTEELSRRFPTHTIVVRPHPNESHAPWRAKAAGLPNVKVIYEGNVIEWILASELSIQNNCMTGIEAYALGKTTISYQPMRDERFDLFLPNALSTQAYDLEELVELVGRVLRGEDVCKGEDAARKAEIGRRFIANTSGKRACERIMDTLDAADVPELPLSFDASRLGDLRITARDLLSQVQSVVQGGEARRQFRRQQSSRIRGWELASLLAKTQQATGRFGGVRAYQCKENVFCIY
jgi:surface carbohydrate biosynthesis protein